jgi:hypothetical protein
MPTWRVLTVILALGGLAQASAAQEPAPFRPAAELIANARLADAAMAFADPDRPLIYYNPSMLREVGPELAAFLLAHEEGHIVYQHQRPDRSRLIVAALETLLQRYELEADCYAAGRLSVERPEAVARAIGYFRSLGSFRADREHPTGAERAAHIAACLSSTYGAGLDPG